MPRQSRQTKQKELLSQTIRKLDGFFTAEELQANVPEIGIATVYRYLATSRKHGSLHSYSCKGKTVYSVGQKHHCHFTCERCGSVDHVDLRNLDFLEEQIEGKACHVQIDITGVCKRCKEK